MANILKLGRNYETTVQWKFKTLSGAEMCIDCGAKERFRDRSAGYLVTYSRCERCHRTHAHGKAKAKAKGPKK